jgi:hypothetical protein
LGNNQRKYHNSAKEGLGHYELRKYNPWLEKGCSELLHQKKPTKFQWLQEPSEINGENLNNVRCEFSRHFRNKKKEYLKERINELARNSKNKNIKDVYRGINEFKSSYQHRNKLLKDENGDLSADSYKTLNRWKNDSSE